MCVSVCKICIYIWKMVESMDNQWIMKENEKKIYLNLLLGCHWKKKKTFPLKLLRKSKVWLRNFPVKTIGIGRFWLGKIFKPIK